MQDARIDSKKIEKVIFAERIMLLNKNLLLSIPANFLCSLIVFIGLYTVINPKTLFVWFLATLSIFALHVSVYIFNSYRPLSSEYYLKWLISFGAIYGALWGVAGSVLIPYNNLLDQMLVIIIIIGVASGGLHILQPNLFASLLFFTLSILPLSFWLFYQNTLTYWLLGAALLIYFCFVSIVSSIGYGLLNKNFKLRYENLDLIDELIRINAALEESESRFRSAFNSAAIGMAIVSLEGRWLKVNESLCQIVGYSEKELLNTDFQSITYPEDLKLDLNYIRQLLAGEIRFYHMEKRYIHKNGDIIWILLSVSLIRDPENKPLQFIAQIQNIDTQKRAEQELKYIAHHDVLTGLGNRKQLEISFNHALAYAIRYQKQIAILFMDLDYFKRVNDNLGHDIGDLLLIEIGKRLKTILRSTDILVRQGGDEFIIALTELSNVSSVETIAKKILDAVAKTITIKRHDISITGSIGISLYPADGCDLNSLIKQADEALYAVKSTGKNNYRLSSAALL
ncbi:sensor domain-containing diguanylate cyclase [Legionella qingyii]|uniref:Sensor domain-containing diguanylate cyclase n=1 Tax=Legionella qingyii TaxID=2184757 RepID=A0A317U5F7_9GAMM|nr:GGDEF domain-containing protein [Legionella qingyii]PWY56409.1 sensor domain-containing diguanylate cyclase [Legionella qingyii]PWY57234.1 sensor domain-containing diguanylate cyclase [Legionella qingyii]RUR24926.1 sensor domain-containing diguanylate cyclase [Legionella qingyii]RUR28800.1 sensor domain-containing diguanylate cyclase [Legionella qingyii]